MTMYKARYYKTDGSKGRARSLPDNLFDGVVNKSVLHQVVRATLANQRQGTAAKRNRSAVRGGSRKPWRQKGTGRARQGTTRAAQWVGGGMAFPPQAHSWRQDVPKKVRQLARRSALNARAEADQIVLVDDLHYDAPSTKALRQFLDSVEADGKVLILTDGTRSNLFLSSRNLPGVAVCQFGQECAYDLLWAQTVIIERSAVDSASDNARASATEPAAEPAAEPAETVAAGADTADEEASDA